MFLIDSIKPKVEKKLKAFFTFFALLFSRVELEAYTIRPVLFLFALGLLAETKTSKERRKVITIFLSEMRKLLIINLKTFYFD